MGHQRGRIYQVTRLLRGGHRRAMHGNKALRLEPLEPNELETCRETLRRSWLPRLSARALSVVIVAFADRLPVDSSWKLGETAALHGLPLILLGYGKTDVLHPKVTGYQGPASYNWPKVAAFYSMRRVLQLLDVARDGTAAAPLIFYADAFDTIVVNSAAAALASDAARRMLAGELDGLWSGECNSWPKCLRSRYERNDAYASKLRGGLSPLFLNAGLAVGSSAGWARLLRTLLPALSAQEEDQLTANELHLANKLGGWQVDAETQLTLSMLRCYDYANRSCTDISHSVRRAVGCPTALPKFNRCATRPFDPAPRTLVARRGAARGADGAMGPRTAYTSERGATAFPLVAHCAGRVRDPFQLFKGKPISVDKAARFAHFAAALPASHAERAAVAAHPVLLVDSGPFGTCGVSTLGDLHNGTTGRRAARARPLELRWRLQEAAPRGAVERVIERAAQHEKAAAVAVEAESRLAGAGTSSRHASDGTDTSLGQLHVSVHDLRRELAAFKREMRELFLREGTPRISSPAPAQQRSAEQRQSRASIVGEV